MIPTSYLFRDIYDQHWGNPRDMEPMDPTLPQPGNGKGCFIRIYGFITALFARRTPPAPMMQNCSTSGL